MAWKLRTKLLTVVTAGTPVSVSTVTGATTFTPNVTVTAKSSNVGTITVLGAGDTEGPILNPGDTMPIFRESFARREHVQVESITIDAANDGDEAKIMYFEWFQRND